ncbi:hypothetical protein VIGAN_06240100, partial [Vigna angularis var. angularis]
LGGSAHQHICCPKRTLSLPSQFHPCIHHCPPHTLGSIYLQLPGVATWQPIIIHPTQQQQSQAFYLIMDTNESKSRTEQC